MDEQAKAPDDDTDDATIDVIDDLEPKDAASDDVIGGAFDNHLEFPPSPG